MWSLIQKRYIKKEVELAWQRRSLSPHSMPQDTRDHSILQSQNHALPVEAASQKEDQEQSKQNFTRDGMVVVQCESTLDPINPRNWPLSRRATTLAILGLLVFTQSWAGASDALAHNKAKAQYRVCTVAMNLSTAVYLFGIGSGCLLVGPLSETCGRSPVYLVFTFAYLFFELGSALSNSFVSQIVCRYLVGLASSATMGINGASVGDMFTPVERTFWFPAIAWVNVVPPITAPIVAGWVVNQQALDWRWTEWITLIISAFAFLVAFIFLPETYLPILLEWKAQSLRQVSGKSTYVSEHAQSSSFFGQLQQNLPLTVSFAATEPAILALGGFLVLLYILLFSFLSGFDFIFKDTYGLDSLQEGACFASIAIGATVFTVTTSMFYAWTYHKHDSERNKTVVPESRLRLAIATAPLLPISLFWLGWTNYASTSIYSGLAACFCFGVVLIAMYIASYQYILDSYGNHAAIALASITMMRYVIAGGMVIAARPMYAGIGVHWTMTLLGCVATLLAPAPFILTKRGKMLRERSQFAD